MRSVVLGGLALGLAFAGCGGAGGTTTACTLGTGASRVCLEIWTNVAAPGGAGQAAADCQQGGGIATTTCPHDGADGGCRMSIASGAVMETTTQWFYAGMAASEMTRCTMQAGNTWISP